MEINIHNILTINDENDVDSVGDFLETLREEAKTFPEAKMHLLFIERAFSLLSSQPLESLLHRRTTLTITIDGSPRTKSYELVKLLGVNPVYELRYAKNGNRHIRLLFFPYEYNGQSNYVFVKCFVKTKVPPVDETDKMRDLTYQMYLKVCQNPQDYLEGIEWTWKKQEIY